MARKRLLTYVVAPAALLPQLSAPPFYTRESYASLGSTAYALRFSGSHLSCQVEALIRRKSLPSYSSVSTGINDEFVSLSWS